MARGGAFILLAVVLLAAGARADEEPNVAEARTAFVRGNELAKQAQWAEALAAFERSAQLRSHPLTTYNIAVCERALGRYAHARDLFRKVVDVGGQDPAQFPPSRVAESQDFLREIDGYLAHLEITLDPPGAAIAVDGRPLRYEQRDGHTVGVAGVLEAGAGTPPPSPSFEIEVDPGPRVLRLSAPGFSDILLAQSLTAGARLPLKLEMARLPATFRITTNVVQPQVLVNGADVGVPPLSLSRPAGTYHVVVKKDGFVPYDSQVRAAPGQDVNLPVNLTEEKTPITKRWWFWTGVVAVVAGGVAITYAATREPSPAPPYNGGSTNWVAFPK
jgi:hypothetical protein